MTTITTAAQWADALDGLGTDVGPLISVGYADGQIVGVALSYDDERADDERGVLVSADGAWVVRYDAQAGYWIAQ